MATIDISRSHSLGKDTAKQRSEQVLKRLEGSYGIKGAWAGDVFKIDAPVKGNYTVTESSVRVELDLPFLMKPMKGKIEERIESELSSSLK